MGEHASQVDRPLSGDPGAAPEAGPARPGDIRGGHHVAPLDEDGADQAAAAAEILAAALARGEVRRGARQLRLAMECAGHVYWELDVPGGRFAAGAPWTLLGYGEQELDGSLEAWLRLRHPEDQAPAEEAYRAHVEGWTDSLRSELRCRAKDGGYRWLLASGRAIARGADGRALRLAGTATDVTDAKRIEQQLRHADRLASVGTLVAGLAHEVNNPLACVIANLGYVAEGLERRAHGDLQAPGEAALQEAIREAQVGADRVRAIVQGLRVFASPARSGPREPVDPRAQIHAAVALVRNQIVARARLRVDLPPALPLVLVGERELTQILVSLLVNAAQAIPEGRSAENEVAVSAEAADRRLVLTVRDTGVGIAAQNVDRVFDPFFTTRPVGSGTGLGLSMCHGMVHALGGRIEVEAAPGKGSCFKVVLPIAGQAAARPAAEPAPGGPRRARVLVVDDEPLVARGLARVLASRHEVAVLTSPREALARAQQGESWDVILCDLMMPEMNGMALEAELARCRPELVWRMVYLTGGAFTEGARAFLDSGRPFVEKPVQWDQLRGLVDEVIGRGPSASAAGAAGR